ncbi:MAG: transposase [Paludibacteraceae bacterium]|nr:transposase [Paludibacteraceae bacterium]
MEKFQNKYCIPSARANWHNYNGGVYFVTICTKNREHYLGEICPGPQMQLSPIGQYVYNQFINVKTHYPYAKIPLFVIMPDHIHAIVTIDGENEIGGNGVHTQCRDVARRCGDVARNVSTTGVNTQMANISPRKNSLAVVIRGVKSSITHYANENNIPFAWQTRFHDRIIRNQAELDRISDYIEKNVVNWHDDL